MALTNRMPREEEPPDLFDPNITIDNRADYQKARNKVINVTWSALGFERYIWRQTDLICMKCSRFGHTMTLHPLRRESPVPEYWSCKRCGYRISTEDIVTTFVDVQNEVQNYFKVLVLVVSVPHNNNQQYKDSQTHEIVLDIISNRYHQEESRSKEKPYPYIDEELDNIAKVFFREMKRRLQVECSSIADFFVN